MDTISVTPTASQINRDSTVAWRQDVDPVERSLLALVPSIEDTVPIDDALAVCTLFVPADPYRPIRDACDRGLIVAQFTEPVRGSTLREIVLRRI